jgi:hypothetical protein
MGETVTTNTQSDQTATGASQAWQPATNFFKHSQMPLLWNTAENYGAGQGLYSGSYLADQNPMINQAWNWQMGMLPNMASQFQNTLGTAQGFLDVPSSFQYDSPENQAARDALGQRISRTFNQSIIPGLEDAATNAGQFGGNQMSIAMGGAAGGLADSIASAEVGLTNRLIDLYEGDLNRAYGTMGQMPGLIGSQLLPSQIMGDIGVQKQTRAQQELLDSIGQFEAPYLNTLQAMGNTQQLGLPLAGLGSTSNQTAVGNTYAENYYPSSYLDAGGGSTAGNVVSGAIGGASTGAAVSGGNPYGALVGGVIGGAGALF